MKLSFSAESCVVELFDECCMADVSALTAVSLVDNGALAENTVNTPMSKRKIHPPVLARGERLERIIPRREVLSVILFSLCSARVCRDSVFVADL